MEYIFPTNIPYLVCLYVRIFTLTVQAFLFYLNVLPLTFSFVCLLFIYHLQWQSRTKSIVYLIYRWLIALFFTAVVIDSMLEKEEGSSTNFWLYFIYLTNWGVMLCMFTNLLGAILVTTWHFHPEYAG